MHATRKSYLLALILITLLALIAVGCGDGGGTASVDDGGTTDDGGGTDDGGDPDDGDDGNGGEDPPVVTDTELIPQWAPTDFDQVYTVGPGQEYDDPSEVPWESLEGSTLVQIHWRSAPYRTKWVINTVATAEAPLVVVGIADDGRRPVISGENAVTRRELNYWNEVRSVVKVGGSNLPTDDVIPAHIVIQGLEIRSARPAYTFTDDNGQAATYALNAAAIHVEVGEDIRIIDCVLHDAGNGLFSGHGSGDLLIRACHLYDNGIEESDHGTIQAGLHHNSYTESAGIVFEYNHYGPLRDGALGNNLKDRSAGTVVRYNWIEGGNRQLDLVQTSYADIDSHPAYDETFVYGNILVEPEDAGNRQILHYGGDGGYDPYYREGTLYFYHNTVISFASAGATLMRLATNAASADVRNNLLFGVDNGAMAILDSTGQVQLTNNWLPNRWRETFDGALDPGAAIVAVDNTEGGDPGFMDVAGGDYRLTARAAAADCGGAIAPAAVSAEGAVAWQYQPHQSRGERPDDGLPDAGAFEMTP